MIQSAVGSNFYLLIETSIASVFLRNVVSKPGPLAERLPPGRDREGVQEGNSDDKQNAFIAGNSSSDVAIASDKSVV